MNQPIKRAISEVYELEGLLLLIQNHGENTDQFIYEMVRTKAKSITELVSALSPEIFSKTTDNLTPQIDQTESEEPKVELDDTINLSEFEGIMLGSDNSYDLDELECEEKAETIENDEIEVEIIYDDNSEEEEEEEETIITEESPNNPISETSVRKAFSLNDRFRYKRELFENSDIVMNNTLDLVDAMQSFAEAEDYFYNDMQWDNESQEVIDFMFIIRTHFK